MLLCKSSKLGFPSLWWKAAFDYFVNKVKGLKKEKENDWEWREGWWISVTELHDCRFSISDIFSVCKKL